MDNRKNGRKGQIASGEKLKSQENRKEVSFQSMLIYSVVYTVIWLSTPPLGQAAVAIRHKNYKW
jgi:hypothetical protein